jgi:hypothetical protein
MFLWTLSETGREDYTENRILHLTQNPAGFFLKGEQRGTLPEKRKNY